MTIYKLDYTIEKVLSSAPTSEQILLKEYTGASFAKKEAGEIWQKVMDHKWYISERLGRDTGYKVAAVDFMENIYEAPVKSSRKTGFRNAFFGFFEFGKSLS